MTLKSKTVQVSSESLRGFESCYFTLMLGEIEKPNQTSNRNNYNLLAWFFQCLSFFFVDPAGTNSLLPSIMSICLRNY